MRILSGTYVLVIKTQQGIIEVNTLEVYGYTLLVTTHSWLAHTPG